MDIEGTYTLQASPQDVWSCLMDQHMLQRVIPGAQEVKTLGENTYAVSMRIGPTPLTGSYHGHIALTEQHYPNSYRVAIEGEGCQRTINGEGSVRLSEHGEHTVVAYKGKLHLGKSATSLPASVAKGAAKLLIQQFFTSLADQLRARNSTPITTAEHAQDVPARRHPAGTIVVLPTLPQTTPLVTLVRRLGLGAGHPAAEERWVSRIKWGALVLALLVLVWIGTRILSRR